MGSGFNAMCGLARVPRSQGDTLAHPDTQNPSAINSAGSASAAGLDVAVSGGSGAITVTGTQSVLSNSGSFIIGDAGLGSLSINAGGTVTTTASATIANTTSASGSAIDVTGAGSNLHVTGTLTVGQSGYGDLAVAAGGTVTAGALALGAASGGDGVLSVAGTGAAVSVTGSAAIGGPGCIPPLGAPATPERILAAIHAVRGG